MRTKSRKRKHKVSAQLQVDQLAKAGSALYLDIYADDQKIGRVEIGRGSFTWYGGSRKIGKQIAWSTFATLLDEHCYG